MSYKFSLFVSLRYFVAKKNEALVSFIARFSMCGIMLGVAALIVVMAVMNGFHIELTRNIIGINSDISISSRENSIANTDHIMSDIVKLPFVKHANVLVVGQALASSVKASTGVIVKGMNLSDLKYKNQIVQNIIAGEITDLASKNCIAIGKEMSIMLGLGVGDTVKLLSPNTIASPFGSLPRAKDFKVSAIFASGLYEFDATTILTSLHDAELFFKLASPNLIEIYTTEHDNAFHFSKELRGRFPDLRIISWEATHEQYLSALKVERVAMFTILSLIIVVAAFNIISSLFMLVKDKTKDIAILRTIGASKADIMLIFIINGMLVGFIGTFLGVILGVGFAKNIEAIRGFLEQITGVKIFDAAIYLLSYLPAKILVSDVIMVSSMSMFLCFIATIYPAYKAANLDPVEAMRYE